MVYTTDHYGPKSQYPKCGGLTDSNINIDTIDKIRTIDNNHTYK